jgi:tetratricopeptide (TPR) repeat protein
MNSQEKSRRKDFPLHPGVVFWLFLLVFSLGWHARNQVLIRDDDGIVFQNPEIRRVFPILRHFTQPETFSIVPEFRGTFRPLVPLSFSISYSLHGLDAASFRIYNLLIHALSAVLVFLLALRLAKESYLRGSIASPFRLALLCSTLFAIHPLSGLTIRYVAARGLLQAVFFLLLFLLSYLHMDREEPGVLEWTRSLFFLLLSILSKENGYMAPALILLIEVILRQRSLRSFTLWKRTLPPAILVASVFFYPLLFLKSTFNTGSSVSSLAGWLAYVASQGEVLVTQYLANFIWPLPLRWYARCPDASLTRPLTLASFLVLVALLTFAWRRRREHPLQALGLLTFLTMLIPTSLTPMAYRSIPYRPYAGSAFFYLALACWIVPKQDRLLPRILLSLWLVMLMTVSIYHGQLGSSRSQLWGHSVRYGATGLGQYLLLDADRDLRVEERTTKLLTLVQRYPNLHQARMELGILLLLQGKLSRARWEFEDRCSLLVDRGLPFFWRGLTRELQNDLQGAQQDRQRAIDLGYKIAPEKLFWVADGAIRRNQLAVASVLLREYELRKPHDPRSAFARGVVQLRMKKASEAYSTFQEALDRGANFPLIHQNMGVAQVLLGNCGQARKHLLEALRQAPDSPLVRQELQRCAEENP